MPDSRRKARLWIKIDLGEGRQIGPGKIALLKAIAEQRSIAGAARSLSMSYRRAWLLVDEMNRDLGSPVVETRVGGRGRGGARYPVFETPGANTLAVTPRRRAAAGGQ